MRSLLVVVCCAGVACLGALAAGADAISVTSRDGAIALEGEFLSFDGEFLRLDSQYGVVTVDADTVVCEGADCPTPGAYVPDIMISGAAEGVGRLLPAMLEAYAAERGYGYVRQVEDADHFLYLLVVPEEDRRVARIRFRRTTTREGFADLIAEQADLVLALRDPTEAERAVATDAGAGDLASARQRLVLANDAVVVALHPDNPIDALSQSDLDGIVSGEVKDWSDIGDADAPIAVHLPEPSSGAGRRIADAIGAPPGATLHGDAAAVARAVSADPHALGLTLFSARQDVKIAGLSCGRLSDVTARAVANGDYPLSFPVVLYLPGRRLPAITRDFVAFLRSETAQSVATQNGFAGRSMKPLALRQQGDRLLNAILASGGDVSATALRRVVERLDGAERLSFTFRFTQDGTALDAASTDSLDRLAARIDDGLLQDARLVLAGFTDGEGSAAVNRALSEERAGAVRDQLVARVGGADRIAAEGFGEAMPVACDDTAAGAAANRRVEAWIVRDAPRP